MSPLKTSAAVIAALAIGSAALAQDDQVRTGSLLVVAGQGDYDWRIGCDLVDGQGGAKSYDVAGRGRNAKGSVIGRRIASGSCTATASERAPVIVSVTSRADDFACPFEPIAAGVCERELAAGETATFEIALR